jgi:hypothetical protein
MHCAVNNLQHPNESGTAPHVSGVSKVAQSQAESRDAQVTQKMQTAHRSKMKIECLTQPQSKI